MRLLPRLKRIKMDLRNYVAEEMNRYNGVYFPVKSSVLRRLLVRKLPCGKLHPNPEDEFCDPKIGPSDRIISEYKHKFIEDSMHPYGDLNEKNDPIVVEKMHPDGYIIVNGHHRWAASMMLQKKCVPVRVVNLTHEADIKRMLEKSTSDKRVTLDLDEVVFGIKGEESLEKRLPFPLNYEYKQRLRSGIPALFHYFKNRDYDIWVYTSNFYSFDYLNQLFKKYHVKVDGVVTGTAKKSGRTKGKIDRLMSEKYKSTVHIDRNIILKTTTGSSDYEEKEIVTEELNWSLAVMKLFDELS